MNGHIYLYYILISDLNEKFIRFMKFLLLKYIFEETGRKYFITSKIKFFLA